MALSDQETTALEIIARYSFLTECQEKHYIAEEKYKEIILGFGTENLEMFNNYAAHIIDTLDLNDRVPGESL